METLINRSVIMFLSISLIACDGCIEGKLRADSNNFQVSNDIQKICIKLKDCSFDSLKSISTTLGYEKIVDIFFDGINTRDFKKQFLFLSSFISQNDMKIMSDSVILIVEKGDEAINSISSMEIIKKNSKWLINNFMQGK